MLVIITIAAFISPNNDIHEMAIRDDFLEIYVNTPLAECGSDVKGQHKNPVKEKLKFTGISKAPFEHRPSGTRVGYFETFARKNQPSVGIDIAKK